MPIALSELRSASARAPYTRILKSLTEALASNKQSAFLCHSHKDSDLAEGLQVVFADNGWELYIDWKDHQMPETPTRATAEKIQRKILELDWFLYLATPNSATSRWCPWEIGYADAKKGRERLIVIPTVDNSGAHFGSEYLQLYNQVTTVKGGGLARFAAGQSDNGTYLRYLR